MQDYHQLDIWNRAMDYAVAVYEFATALPEQEKYNLASQLRRAVASAPLNIAEGCGGGYQLGVCAIPQLCLSLVEGGRHRFGTLRATLSSATSRPNGSLD